ncbi:MAG: hypothetical protein AAB692_04370 [Patescibacteria group bacterium]
MRRFLLILSLTACATPPVPPEPQRKERVPCSVPPGKFIGESHDLGHIQHRYRAEDGTVYSCPLDTRCLWNQYLVPNNKFINPERCVNYCRCAPELF